MTIKVHDLQAGARRAQERHPRRPRHRRPRRQDRRPRHQGPGRPRHHPDELRGWPDAAAHAGPEAQGLQQPVPRRVPGRQPRHPRGPRPRPTIDPGVLHGHGLTHKGALVKVLGRGELTRKVTVKAHAVSEGGRARPSPPPAVRWRSCPSRGAIAARRPRATTSPTASRTRVDRPAPCSPACATCSGSRISGTRSSSRSLILGDLPAGRRTSPCRASTSRR